MQGGGAGEKPTGLSLNGIALRAAVKPLARGAAESHLHLSARKTRN
jgi:hypothetical protein